MSFKRIKSIQAYLAKIEPAVSGNGGHNQTFKVACVLIHGFGLSDTAAWPFLKAYSERCAPPWSDKELRHKLKSARRTPSKIKKLT
jgi:hypothetical protein